MNYKIVLKAYATFYKAVMSKVKVHKAKKPSVLTAPAQYAAVLRTNRKKAHIDDIEACAIG